MKKLLLFLGLLFIPFVIQASETVSNEVDLASNAKSAIIIEQSSGQVLYEKNSHEKIAPASMTKMMSLLLIMEKIDSGKIKLDDVVTVSKNASSMGGSQILLEENEQMTVQDLLKGVAIASGNELAVSIKQSLLSKEEIII